MTKELKALEQLKYYNTLANDDFDMTEELSIIETALKRLAVYETFDLLDEKDDVDKLTDIKGKLTYVDKVMDTQERLLESVSADEIRILNSVLNSQIKTLKKKLKALEIIKKKMLCIDFKLLLASTDYEIYCFWVCNKELTKEEYELLKEVLL